MAVLLSTDRSNHIIDGVLSADTASEIQSHLKPHIQSSSVLCSYGAWPYVNIAKLTNSDHKRLISRK